jgi:hypothetical protein
MARIFVNDSLRSSHGSRPPEAQDQRPTVGESAATVGKASVRTGSPSLQTDYFAWHATQDLGSSPSDAAAGHAFADEAAGRRARTRSAIPNPL